MHVTKAQMAVSVMLACTLGAAAATIVAGHPTSGPAPAKIVAPTVRLPKSMVEVLAGATAEPVPAGMAEALAGEPGQSGRDWTACTAYIADTTYVVCPDGFWLSS